MSIADFFFGRKQNSTNSRRSVKFNRNAVRTRTLSMEPLETRDLLSVTTGYISYYNDIVAEYPEFNLPTNQDDINIITVDLDEGATELKLEDLKSAIETAGTTTQPDLILVKTSASANSVTYTSNEDEITIDIDSTQYGSVTIIGWGEEKFTLDANQMSRVMTVYGESTIVNIGGLTITNGEASSNLGGGIYNYSGSLMVTNCEFSGNTGSSGGGIYNSGILTVTSSEIFGNTASSSNGADGGGGIYNSYGTVTIIDSEISGNTASGRDSAGGGIHNASGALTVTNCRISENAASGSSSINGGGGIYSIGSKSTLAVTNSTILGNTAKSKSGGGIVSCGTMTLTNSTISGNTAKLCGGIDNDNNGTLTIINSTISGNTATYYYGGGIFNGGTLSITNSTVSGNTANSYGGGIYNARSSSTSKVYNSIIACNTATNGKDVYNNTGSVYEYNSLSSYTEWDDGTDNIVYDPKQPLFIDATNGDYRLAVGSQAIDKGNNTYAVDADGVALAYDMDGTPRIANGIVDIGAYEYDLCTTLPIPKTSIFIKYSTQVFGVNIYPVDNATGYLIEYSLYEDFSDSVIIDAQVGENELVAFQKPQSCYWRIKTLGDNLNYLDSDYSAIRSISLNVPLRDILLSTNTPEVGTVIRATLNPADATAEYQWYCGETLIQCASDSTFTVTADQIGQTITCVATGINGYNNTVSATTESVPAITLDTPVIFPLKTYNNTIVVANWSSVDNANSYMFEYQRDDADKWTAISGLQNTSASFIGELGQTYNVRIKAIGTGIYTDSTYSQVQTVTIADTLDAHNDFVKMTFNSSAVINYRDNDDATDWSAVTVQFGEASHGEYVVNEDGTISYTPENGFFGTDTIGYVLFSPSGKASVGSISISVGLPIATSVQKTSSSHSPSSAMAPSVDSLTDWENCCIELWAQGVNELNSGETTVTLEYNPAVYEVPYFSACADGVALAASEGVVLPNGNVEIQLTVQVLEPIESQTDNLFLGTVVLTPSEEEGSGVEDGSNVPACVLEGVELTTSVETMPYDMNHNGAIDVNDFVAFATVFGTNLGTMSPDNPLYAQALKADFNKDGIVNIDDFIAFSINFGATKKRVEIPASQASAAADSGNREWEAGNREVIDSQVETPDAQSASPTSQLVTRNSQLEVESSMTLLEAFSAALLDLYDNQESFDQAETSAVLAESRTELPVASFSDDSSQNTLFDAVDAVLEEDLLAIDWE